MIKISNLRLAESLKGLFTIGEYEDDETGTESVKIELEFLDAAANTATTAAALATSAASAAALATEGFSEAIETTLDVANHPTIIGDDNYVYQYDSSAKKYIKTDIYVKGEKGGKGETGNTATISVGEVISVPSNETATITNTGSPSEAIFDFTIPRGIEAKTPVRGTDYWTIEDKSYIIGENRAYIDNVLIVLVR